MQPIWEPDPQRIAASNMTAFMRYASERTGSALSEYEALWQWSVERREEFWPAVWSFCGIVASRQADEVLRNGERMPGANWFSGARLNFAENLLRYRDERPAIVFWNENGPHGRLTHRALYLQAASLAAALRGMGVEPGDRVAAFMPNLPETVAMMLAAASCGAIFSSCSPDFGTSGVVDRFGQIEPKVLVAADGYQYAGRTFDCLPRIAGIQQAIPSIRHTIVVGYQQPRPPLDGLKDAVLLADLLQAESGDCRFEQLPFDHPLYILYSSGTTGVPKCIVHGAGGTLLQHQKEHVLHVDLKRGDKLLYFTTCGWMMWNWLATALATGCTILLYDGSPFHPHSGILFDMADAEEMTVFGTSAKYISALEKSGARPMETHRLDSLRTILSTGSPLLSESYDYVYDAVKRDVCLASISGGTDLVSCFALGNPIGPVWRGEISARGLGMKVEVFSDDGRPLVGEKGELVCTRAFPSMPVGFWNDPGDEKYRAAYFERFPNVWHHGDYAELTERGSLKIFGRSDAVLNPGGVRIGTAEIYRQVEQLPEVLESIVVGQQWQGDVRIVLFVRLQPGHVLDDELAAKIKQQIRTGATPRHVPAKVLQVDDIPRTRSGKIVEIAVRNVIHEQPVSNADALANPEALEQFRNRAELAT